MSHSLLLKNIGQLLTMRGIGSSNLGIIQNAYLACNGDKITAVGKMKNLDRKKIPKQTNVIDVQGKVVMPGLIDCHTHLIFAGSRLDEFEQRLAGASYENILKKGGGILRTVEATRKASKAELIKSALTHLQNYLRQGVTTVEIKTGYGLDLKTELKMIDVMEAIERQSPIRIVKTFLGAHAIPPEFKTKPNGSKTYLQFLIHEILPKLKGRVDFVDIFCEKGAFNLEETQHYLSTAQKMGFKIKIHGEQLHSSGVSSLGAKLKATSLDHCDHIKTADIKKLARSKTVAVLLPLSVLFLGLDQFANGRKLIDAGVPVAIATNFNPGSSPSKNIFLAMSLACLKMGLTIEEALKAVTIHAAHALSIEKKVGSLKPRKQANFIVLKSTDYREVIYKMEENMVERVILDGKSIC